MLTVEYSYWLKLKLKPKLMHNNRYGTGLPMIPEVLIQGWDGWRMGKY
jgi:hypothetical protein